MVPIAASQILCKHLIPAPPHFHRLIFFPNRPKMAGSSNDTEEFSGNGNSDGGGSASSPAVDRSLARAHTMPGGTKYDERREILSGKPDLERSRTEKHGQNFPLDNPTAQLFSDKIPDKEKIQMSTKGGKAVWNIQTTQIFCDVCMTAIDKNMRPGSHFNPNGWKFVVENFQQISGLPYDRKVLKNKWDQLKSDWKLWKELKGKETGLGWDSRFETVDATPDWWASKIAVNKDYAKFRKKGIHPDIETKLDTMFGDTIATGEYTLTPEVHEESAADLGVNEEIDVPMSDTNESVHVATSSRPSSGSQRGKRKNVGASLMRDNMIEMRDFIQQRKNIEARLADAPGCTLDEILEDVLTLPGVDDTSEIFFFACALFRDQRNRAVWKNLKTVDQRMGWLAYMQRSIVNFFP